MLCKDNMTNLDFKSKKNNAKHTFLPFSSFFLFFFFYLLKRITKKAKQPSMKCMNVMQCKS